MKTILDYLKEHKRYEHDVQGRAFELELTDKNIELRVNNKCYVVSPKQTGYEVEMIIQAVLEDDYKINIRFCEECGKPFDAGYIAGDGDWYCCEECFVDAMDKNCGTGKWRPTNNEGQYGGFYEALEEDGWIDTGIYYTEWN